MGGIHAQAGDVEMVNRIPKRKADFPVMVVPVV
jgi:hypothetical protein